jgi:hypothetical protein
VGLRSRHPRASVDLLVRTQEFVEHVELQVNQNTAATTTERNIRVRVGSKNGPCLDPDFRWECL